MNLERSKFLIEFYNTHRFDIPNNPGIYKFIGENNEILYIGKAKNLKKRINSYFTGNNLSTKNLLLLANAQKIDWVVTNNEVESLLLERNLISEYKPKFNILLKYGDGYIGIALSNEEHPRLFTWRGVPPKNAKWFGPFPNVSSKDLYDTILPIFRVRSCSDKIFNSHYKLNKPCLLFETLMCDAPCAKLSERKNILLLEEFLSGKDLSILNELDKTMMIASKEEDFELALLKKRQLEALNSLIPNQNIVTKINSALFISYKITPYLNKILISFGGVRIENGLTIAIQCNYALLDNENAEDISVLLNQFLIYFKGYKYLYLSKELHKFYTDNLVLSDKKVRKMNSASHLPIYNILEKNIESNIRNGLSRKIFNVEDSSKTLNKLAVLLDIEKINRVECIDISHTQGAHPIASIVVSQNGSNLNKEYRKVNIPFTLGGDDLASIKYALYKRFSGSTLGLNKIPEVILIDGGYNQCKVAHELIDEIFIGVTQPPKVISIAKRMEEVFVSGNINPLILSRDSEELKFLMALRDQSHNHAIREHRNKRDKLAILNYTELFDFLPASTRKSLLEKYPSIDLLIGATEYDLSLVKGVTPAKARKILKITQA